MDLLEVLPVYIYVCVSSHNFVFFFFDRVRQFSSIWKSYLEFVLFYGTLKQPRGIKSKANVG